LIDAFWDVRATTVSATYSASAQLTTTEIGMAPLNQTAHWQASAIALSTASHGQTRGRCLRDGLRSIDLIDGLWLPDPMIVTSWQQRLAVAQM